MEALRPLQKLVRTLSLDLCSPQLFCKPEVAVGREKQRDSVCSMRAVRVYSLSPLSKSPSSPAWRLSAAPCVAVTLYSANMLLPCDVDHDPHSSTSRKTSNSPVLCHVSRTTIHCRTLVRTLPQPQNHNQSLEVSKKTRPGNKNSLNLESGVLI